MERKLTRYRELLEAKASELEPLLQERTELAIETSTEVFEHLTLATQRELAIVRADRSYKLLKRVRAALKRLTGGEYGLCEDCGRAIPDKRLSAIPWAERCIGCQQRADERQPGSAGGVRLLAA